MSTWIALDPGGSTGIATYSHNLGLTLCTRSQDDMWTFLDQMRSVPDTIYVVEQYVINARTAELTRQYAALEIIGAAQMVAYLTHSEWHHPMPSARMKREAIEALEFNNLPTPRTRHEWDALGHLMGHMYTKASKEDLGLFSHWLY